MYLVINKNNKLKLLFLFCSYKNIDTYKVKQTKIFVLTFNL